MRTVFFVRHCLNPHRGADVEPGRRADRRASEIDQGATLMRDDVPCHEIGPHQDREDSQSDCFRRGNALQRRSFDHVVSDGLERIAEAFLQPLAIDEAGGDRIDANFRCERARQGDREVVESGFRCAVGNRTAHADEAGDTRRHDDLAAFPRFE